MTTEKKQILKYKPKKIEIFPAKLQLRTITDFPKAITDGFSFDLYAYEQDVEKASNLLRIDKKIIDRLITKYEQKYVLSLPKYRIKSKSFNYYVVFNLEKISIGVQEKYYDYFKIKYPKCEMYQNNDCELISVYNPLPLWKESVLVGGIMPVMLPEDVKNECQT